MNVTFINLNNNDTEHKIIFKSLTYYSHSAIIAVNFDGVLYKAMVRTDKEGNKYFRHYGTDYYFTVNA